MIERCDRLRQRDSPVCTSDVAILDQLAVNEHNALSCRDRLGVCYHDAARPGDLLRRWCEDGVGGGDRLWVNERLAVKSQLATLLAGGEKTCVIGKVEMDAVQDRQSKGASSQQAQPERRQ